MGGSSRKATLTVKDFGESKVSFDLPRKYREEDISRHFVGRSKETLLAG